MISQGSSLRLSFKELGLVGFYSWVPLIKVALTALAGTPSRFRKRNMFIQSS